MSVIINGDTGITTPAETVQGALTTTGNTILGDATTDTLNVGAGGLVKDASGNVGIGTASPTSRLQVGDATVNTSNGIILGKYNAASEANLPAIRQISAGTGNDLAIAATSGSGAIRFYTGGANSSLDLGTASNAERMRLDSSGNLLVGNTSQIVTEKFGVTGTGTYVAAFTNNTNTSGYNVLRLGLSPNGGNTSSYFLHGNTNTVGNWYLFGNGTTSFTSDQRLKKNIETTRGGYAQDLCKLRVVKYNWWKDDDETPKELGLIAQEVAQVFPNLVMDDPSRVSEDDDTVYKTLKQSVLPFMLLKAIQEQQALITQLQEDVATLKALSA